MKESHENCYLTSKITCNQSTQTEDLDNTKEYKGVKHPIEFTWDRRFCLKLSTIENPSEITSYLLDTGAQINIITAKRAIQIGAAQINRTDQMGIQGIANKNPIGSIGSMWVHLKIGTYVIPTKFYVINDLSVPAILGAEFIKEHVHSIEDNFEVGIFKTNAQIKGAYMGENQVRWDVADYTLRNIHMQEKLDKYVDGKEPDEPWILDKRDVYSKKRRVFYACSSKQAPSGCK